MKKRTTDTMMNFDSKSNLAKLLATENIEVQHNNVKTASFNLVDRILTIPVFKNPKGAVYDMLIAHEVSHALHTPQKDWEVAVTENPDIRDYINIIEDIRIDKMIQNKYPGVVQDYLDGFKILWNDNFFGARDKDLDLELQLADKINLFYKSSKTLSFDFDNAEKLFVDMCNQCVTFNDVVEAAKKLAEWQKKQNENLKKLPDFDSHPLTKMYGEQEKKDDDEENQGDNQSQQSDNQSTQSDQEKKSGEDKSDKQNEQSKEEGSSDGEDANTKENNEDKSSGVDKENQTGNPDGAGGNDVKINMPLKTITQSAIDKNIGDKYVDNKAKGFAYLGIPEAQLKNIIVPTKRWIKDGLDAIRSQQSAYNPNYEEYSQFKKDSARTISYLVKEFEMKKSADGYKRSTTDKTGIIDPLKLHQYKISEDIFKRLSVIPDSKNHGMILLLDWSGSMSNVIDKTVEQLLQLVWFCQRIGIPYKVYFFCDPITERGFNNRRREGENLQDDSWRFKVGSMQLNGFNLVEVASHTLKKQELDKSLFLLYAYAKYYCDNYGYRRNREWVERIQPPSHFYLSSTPLNESLASMYQIVPMFRQKYQVDKMSLITLTDGHSNNSNKSSFYTDPENPGKMIAREKNYGATPVLKFGRKELKLKSSVNYTRNDTTALLLEGIKKKFNVTTIGFFLVQNTRRWEFENYALSGKQQELPYHLKEEILSKIRKEFSKEKCASVKAEGYNEFFLVNSKTMKVENNNLNELKEDAKKGDIKRVFGKSMKSRTVSRVLLSKFVKQVA
tara:strand:+ start:18784 stop:21135 length:2352 start_codon:yes stop_codon:yes gene_type:complete